MTENNIIPFSFEDNKVRVLDVNGEPWFVLKDVCSILDLRNPSMVAASLDDDERAKFDLGRSDVNGGGGETNIINESGLYTLIVRSNKPEAKKFRKWVTSEVLPSIRKTGGYSLANVVLTSEDPLERAKAFVAVMEAERQKQLVLTTRIAEMQPKVNYCDVILNCPDVVSTTVIAKDYGKSAKWMNRYLSDKKIQFKQGGVWFPYQKYAEMGLTQTKTISQNGHAFPHTYWTQKGRLFLYDMLKSDGVLPLIEQ